MKTGDTRERLLRAAERLFAERGFAGTSIRAVTTAAGASLASVDYHFGSKAALYGAVVSLIVEKVGSEQIGRLDDLEAREAAAGREPSAEVLVEALVLPILELPECAPNGGHGRTPSLLCAGIFGSDAQASGRGDILEEVSRVEERFLRALSRTLPYLSESDLQWRLRTAIRVATFVGSSTDPEGPPPEGTPVTAADDRVRLLAFLNAAIRAPSPRDALAGLAGRPSRPKRCVRADA